MMRIGVILFVLLISEISSAQNDSTNLFSRARIDSIFDQATRTQFGIVYPILRVYHYSDKIGKHLLVITESGFPFTDPPNNDTIQVFNFSMQNEKLVLDWKIWDFISNDSNPNSEEFSIWFWTKYFSIKDLDGDGLVDPVLIYGTSGINGTSDGRVKIIVFYKGSKIAIRHQNGTLDFQRNTKVDSSFYNLPITIQSHIKLLMHEMTRNGHSIFPRGWEAAMASNKLYFDENK